jgi:hypothetical protein
MPPRTRPLKGVLRGLIHLAPDRIWRALVGSIFDAPHLRELTTEEENEEEVAKQLDALLEDEVARAEETRKRSDQLLTRVIAAAPLAAGLLVLAVRNPSSAINTVGLVTSIISIGVLLISLFAILGNLGKETFYHPVAVGDIGDGLSAAPLPRKRKNSEVLASIQDREARNNDAVDRLHTANASLIVAVLLGVSAGVMVLVAPPPPPPPAPVLNCHP